MMSGGSVQGMQITMSITYGYMAMGTRGKGGKENQVRVRVRGDTLESLRSLVSKNKLIGNVTANRQAPAVAQLYAAHLSSSYMISTIQGQDYQRERPTTRYTSHH